MRNFKGHFLQNLSHFLNSSMNLSCTSVIFISKTLTVHAGNSIVYLNIFAFIKFIEAFENASCNHIKNKNGLCSVFNAPFDVKLSDSPLTIVQPDIWLFVTKTNLMEKDAMVHQISYVFWFICIVNTIIICNCCTIYLFLSNCTCNL